MTTKLHKMRTQDGGRTWFVEVTFDEVVERSDPSTSNVGGVMSDLLTQIADLSSEHPMQSMTSQDRLRRINALVTEEMAVQAERDRLVQEAVSRAFGAPIGVATSMD